MDMKIMLQIAIELNKKDQAIDEDNDEGACEGKGKSEKEDTQNR